MFVTLVNLGFKVEVQCLLKRYSVYFDACVGTNQSARCASDAIVGIEHVSKVIATIVHFIRLQLERVGRASHNA